MISVIIPFRNRNVDVLKRCVSTISRVNSESGNKICEIIVVDYGSEINAEITGARIIPVKIEGWNKCHAINIGVKNSIGNFIMTIDVDMILSTKHMSEILSNIKEDNFIIDTNVRRINLSDITDNRTYDDLITLSSPWATGGINQLANYTANGGIQVYSKNFYNKINGLPESLGIFWGAEDNWIVFQARIHNMNIVDLSYPLLHIEHEKDKLTDEEKDIFDSYLSYKRLFLDNQIRFNLKGNSEPIAKEKPSDSLFKQFKRDLEDREKLISFAVKNNKNYVDIAGQRYKLEKQKPSVLITIINNGENMPNYFIWDLFKLYSYTKEFYPNVDIQQVSACDVAHMRNLSAKISMGNNDQKIRYKYLVQLDTDHNYHYQFLKRFLDLAEEHDIDIITGCTDGKKVIDSEGGIFKFKSTQYKKLKDNINDSDNCISVPEGKDELIQIEASGPVGMLINTRVFDKLEFPFYETVYSKISCDCGGKEDCEKCRGSGKYDHVTGNDIVFSNKLKSAGIKIYLDKLTSFPHEKIMKISRGRLIDI